MRALAMILLLGAANSHAALIGRAPVTPGGTDYQAYYDTALTITWLANANLAATNSFGVAGTNADPDHPGLMPLTTTFAWIQEMNSAAYLGVGNWRLPFVVDTGPAGCDWTYGGTDCGWNVQTVSESTVYSELAHMYYVTLGNLAFYDTDGNPTACLQIGGCPYNNGPFSNIQISHGYWTGTPNLTDPNQMWSFGLNHGIQGMSDIGYVQFAWAVTDGDPLAPVPLPAAVWLFGGALGVLAWLKRIVAGGERT